MISHNSDSLRTTRRLVHVMCLLILCAGTLFAQATTLSQPGAGTRRAFTLSGDLNVADESGTGEQKPLIFDVILYNRGNEIIARQRVGNNGRYRFNNIFNGDYYLAVELESIEVARMPILIAASSPEDVRQDLSLRWRSTGGSGGVPGVVNADEYKRSAVNRTLFVKAEKEIGAKDFSQAEMTLREIVAKDTGDYPAWTNLGMCYFIQKDLEAAENSYLSAIAAKADHLPALLNLGRVRLARKNYEGAIESLEAALKVDPKSATANYFLGEAYLALKKGSKAVGYLNEALRLDPVGMADAHLRLGALYNLANYKDRAAAEYEQFLKKKPDYPDRKKLEEYIEANKPKENAPKP